MPNYHACCVSYQNKYHIGFVWSTKTFITIINWSFAPIACLLLILVALFFYVARNNILFCL